MDERHPWETSWADPWLDCFFEVPISVVENSSRHSASSSSSSSLPLSHSPFLASTLSRVRFLRSHRSFCPSVPPLNLRLANFAFIFSSCLWLQVAVYRLWRPCNELLPFPIVLLTYFATISNKSVIVSSHRCVPEHLFGTFILFVPCLWTLIARLWSGFDRFFLRFFPQELKALAAVLSRRSCCLRIGAMASPSLLFLFSVLLKCVHGAAAWADNGGWSRAHATFYGGSDALGTMGKPTLPSLAFILSFALNMMPCSYLTWIAFFFLRRLLLLAWALVNFFLFKKRLEARCLTRG